MYNEILKQLFARSRGISDIEKYFTFRLEAPDILIETAKEVMEHIPPSVGDCAALSACWASLLQDHHSVPAVVVAGDLKIRGNHVFKCRKPVPDSKKLGRVITGKWDGHCWIEVDGIIGDLSIFRTAYAIAGPSHLQNFIVEHFGYGRGGLLCRHSDLPLGMEYVPKYVLNDRQIDGLIGGMGYRLKSSGF